MASRRGTALQASNTEARTAPWAGPPSGILREGISNGHIALSSSRCLRHLCWNSVRPYTTVVVGRVIGLVRPSEESSAVLRPVVAATADPQGFPR